MSSLLVAFLFATGAGPDLTVTDTVDIIEINHVYHEGTDRVRLSQVIFWEFKRYHSSFHVVDYRMIRAVGGRPRYDYKLRRWGLRWYDANNKCMRQVFSGSFRETHTQYDPEQLDIDDWAIQHRRRLTPSR